MREALAVVIITITGNIPANYPPGYSSPSRPSIRVADPQLDFPGWLEKITAVEVASNLVELEPAFSIVQSSLESDLVVWSAVR